MVSLDRQRCALLAATAAVLVGLTGTSSSQGQNLLLDPGFEPDAVTGLPSAAGGDQHTSPVNGPDTNGPWEGYNSYVSPYTGYYSAVVNHTPGGSQSGKTFGQYAGIFQYVNIVPGEAYTAQIWFYNLNTDAINSTPSGQPADSGTREDVRMTFFTGQKGSGGNLYTVPSAAFSGLNADGSVNQNNWVEETVTTQAPPAAMSVQFQAFEFNQNYGPGAMYVDDASLIDTTFNGGGTTNNFSDAGNWNGVAPGQYAPLVFGASNKTTVNNDTAAGTSYYGIVFNPNASSYVLTGNQVNLTALSGVTNNSPNSQTIGLALGLQSDTTFNSNAGNLNVSGSISGAFALNKTGSFKLTLAGSNSYTGATTVNAGTLVVANRNGLPAGNDLTLNAGSIVLSNLGAPYAASVGGLADSGVIDLQNNALVVHSSDLTTVNGLVQAGYNNGKWNGSSGIVSSTAASDAKHLTAVGVITNDNGSGTPLYGSGGTIAPTLDGANSVDGDVLVKYTYYGDTNLDGKVDGTDYARVDAGYLADTANPGSVTGWYNGDFNYDGTINGSDYTLIDNAFNTQGAQLAAQVASPTALLGSAVPEPTAIGLIGISMIGALRRRRRCR